MLSQTLLEQIKQNLIQSFALEKIILFGSHARGTADDRSDIDLVVVVSSVDDKFDLMTRMRQALLPLHYAFDVIILSLQEFERDKKYPGTVARYASREGLSLYER